MVFGSRTMMRGSSRAVLLAVCLATSVTARSTTNIFERASTCPKTSDVGCASTNPGLPSNFCCPSSNDCYALAANTTVLCCPTGSSCKTIKPIDCDITQQNATLAPESIVKTIALNSTMSTCGSSQCCPFGYSCNGGNCVINADQSIPPPGFTTSSSSSSASTSTSPTTSPTTTSSPSSSTTTPLPLTQTCAKFPIPAILVGFFPGLLLGILLTVASLYACDRGRKKTEQERRRSIGGSSFGNISEPQPNMEQDGMRTEFLRKVPPMTPESSRTAGSNVTPGRRNTMKRMTGSLFGRNRRVSDELDGQGQGQWSPSPPMPLNISKSRGGEGGGDRPVTPPNQREQSQFYQDVPIRIDDGTGDGSLRPPPPGSGKGGGSGSGKTKKEFDRESYNTTMTAFIHAGGAPPPGQGAGAGANANKSALAGLPKGLPFRPEYGSPPR